MGIKQFTGGMWGLVWLGGLLGLVMTYLLGIWMVDGWMAGWVIQGVKIQFQLVHYKHKDLLSSLFWLFCFSCDNKVNPRLPMSILQGQELVQAAAAKRWP